MKLQGAQSGGLNACEPPFPLFERMVAESITKNSTPSRQEKIPAARKMLFHMIANYLLHTQTDLDPAGLLLSLIETSSPRS